MAVLADVTCDAAKIEAIAVENEVGVCGPAVGEVPEYCAFGAAGDKNRVHGVRSRPQNSSPEAALACAATRTWHNQGRHLSRDRSDVDGSEGALNNPERRDDDIRPIALSGRQRSFQGGNRVPALYMLVQYE